MNFSGIKVSVIGIVTVLDLDSVLLILLIIASGVINVIMIRVEVMTRVIPSVSRILTTFILIRVLPPSPLS